MACPAVVNFSLHLLVCTCHHSCLQVVDTTRPFEGGYMALSSFGFGGANMHMVFSGRGGQRINLLQSDSSSSDGSVSEDAAADVVTPLAARTSEGLAYLGKIVNEVSRPAFGPKRPTHELPFLAFTMPFGVLTVLE